ncbi:hypothetical protein [Lapillicoccus jejuensis]|uniref:LppP/LprE lipoprotein n=1 Tax=Lapillicoccus jejuensis TaxID=402171 RepID=A0A542DZX7_9MICO|nr:hypothetical protein [Lapillicoccus jejuensis]TQJ08642.1 hypothetical protein FB458_1733 [Lapillicoccus jejuensis]
MRPTRTRTPYGVVLLLAAAALAGCGQPARAVAPGATVGGDVTSTTTTVRSLDAPTLTRLPTGFAEAPIPPAADPACSPLYLCPGGFVDVGYWTGTSADEDLLLRVYSTDPTDQLPGTTTTVQVRGHAATLSRVDCAAGAIGCPRLAILRWAEDDGTRVEVQYDGPRTAQQVVDVADSYRPGALPVPLPTLLSPGPTSPTLRVWLTPEGQDWCHQQQDAVVVGEDGSQVRLRVRVTSHHPAPSDGPAGCPDYAVGPTERTIDLSAPLGTRRVVDDATGRDVPVLDTSTTPYSDGALRAPYVLTGVQPGPVVTWAWLDHATVTLEPQQPVPAGETSFGERRFGRHVIAVSGRPGSVTARWQEDPTHRWQVTVTRPSGDGFVQDGQVVDYGGVLELADGFHPAS